MERLDLCTSCGGKLEFKNGRYVCPFCNAEYVDKPGLPNIQTIFDNAHNFLSEHNFIDAEKAYNNILLNFYPDESNKRKALFGLICASYGVIYDDDGEPHVYKTFQNYEMTKDENVKDLIDLSSGDILDEYKQKINKLEEIRKEYIKKYKDVNYDVFICCKAYDNENNKTSDYHFGEKIYDELRKEGLDVFYGPNSLPSSKGNYEPMIYRAIESSEYMVVVTSNVDDLNDNIIKNEWKRFLGFQEKDSSRRYKVITTSDLQPKIIKNYSDLKEEKDWSLLYDEEENWINVLKKSIEKELNIDFYNLRKERKKPLFEFIDLSSVDRKEDKDIVGYKTRSLKRDESFTVHNPFVESIIFQKLDESHENALTDYHLDSAKVYINDNNFSGANRELREYFREVDEDDYKYEAFKLKLLLSSKSNTLDEFFNNHLEEFNDFDLFAKFIKKLPEQEAKDVLNELKEYIISSIKYGYENNSYNYYELICNIDSPIIDKLNKSVTYLTGIYKYPDKVKQYLDKALPVLSVKNDQFTDICTRLINELCKNNLWEIAQDVLEILNKVEDNYEKDYFELLIDYKVHNANELLEKVEEKDYYHSFGDIIETYLSVGDETMINIIKARIENSLYSNKQFKRINKWIDVIAEYDFEERQEFFIHLLDLCKDNPEGFDMFRAAIKVLSDNKETYIKESIKFIQNNLLRNKLYDPARDLCEEIIKYDQYNSKLLRIYLFALLEDSSGKFEKIYRLQTENLQIIESLLISFDDDGTREEFIIDLLKAYKKYMSDLSEDELKKSVEIFKLIDKLLRYLRYPSDRIKEIVKQFADICLKWGLFEIAQWYYSGLIGWDIEYSRAYWGLILAESNCRDEEEFKKCLHPTERYKEYFGLAFKYANEEELKRYYQKIRDEREKRIRFKPIIKILLFAGIGVILALAGFLIWYFTK